MGMYDTVCGMQVKAGPCEMEEYRRGDRVPLPDGAYLTYEGVFIVEGGEVSGVACRLFDKWGNQHEPSKFLSPFNPIEKMMEEERMKRGTP